jgi:conjugal transfer pilus assembly protein TraA
MTMTLKTPAIKRSTIANSLFALAFVLGALNLAQAGVTGTEFQGLYQLVFDWTTGYLGKAIAIGAFLVGAMVGVVKSTIMPALVGIVFAVLFSVGPTIIGNMMTAVI